MAKFAIALCLLLVACGAQAGLMDSASEMISLAIENASQRIDETLEQLEAFWLAALEMRDEFLAKIASRLAESRENLGAIMEEVATDVQDSSNCVNEAADYEAILEEMQSNAVACVSAIQTELEASANQTREELETFRSVVDEFQTEVKECASGNIFSILPCLMKVASEIQTEIDENGTSMWSRAETLFQQTASNDDALATCYDTDSYKVLEQQAEDAYAVVLECVANVLEE